MMIIACATIALTAPVGGAIGQDDAWKIEPGEQHEWLQRFVGTWDIEVTAQMNPEAEPVTMTGVERVRSLGDIWVIAESEYPDIGGGSILTLGYSPDLESFVGSWVDSVNAHQWVYTGEVNDAGTTLTLFTEGPMEPGEPHRKFRETIEFKSDDHKVMTSQYQDDDGEWVTIVTMHMRKRASGAAR